ncbi:MAG: putative dienelactone hydrolase [Myxococcota bacterium]|jgi:predicted dienelactone hydrolase
MRSTILALALIGCGDKDTDTADTGANAELADYSTAGEHTPTTLESSITATSGVSLTVQAWYPSDATGSGDPITYDDFYLGGAYEGLAAACDSPRPVVVFSHGYGGIRWQTSFFMEHLASHGYVVAAPDHTYNTIFDNDDKRFLEVLDRRPVDLQDTFDWLIAQSDDTSSPLFGCVDAAAGYAVSGHSFGGYTAYATAGATVNLPEGGTAAPGDSRVWAALPMAPWNVSGALTDGTADITVPVMTLSGTLDTTTPWSMVTALHGALTTTPRYLGEFPDAGHDSFAPVSCTAFPNGGDGCGDEFIDLTLFAELVNTAGLSFFESSRGVAGAIEQLPYDSAELLWEIED